MDNLFDVALQNMNSNDINSVAYISEQLNQQIEYAKDFEKGKINAAAALHAQMMESITEKVNNASKNGKGHVCIMTVSTSPLTAHLATHDKQYVPIEFSDKTIKYSYLAIFWTDRWRDLLKPFSVNYKWNANKTLLYVNISWSV